MRALIDADILRYEIGYAAETGWQTEGEVPPWAYVDNLLNRRIENILLETQSDDCTLFLSGKTNFRNDIAITKVYKGTRKQDKPIHFDNLSACIKAMPNTIVSDGVEADDLMAIEQTSTLDTIICSRDKDLRQVPGWHYSWEIGNQPLWGPILVDKFGWLTLDREKKPAKLKGAGFKFFCSQLITGDTVDNIPGLRGGGNVLAFQTLDSTKTEEEAMEEVIKQYRDRMGDDYKTYLLEQGRLLWMVRKWNEDGSPKMWNIGDVG